MLLIKYTFSVSGPRVFLRWVGVLGFQHYCRVWGGSRYGPPALLPRPLDSTTAPTRADWRRTVSSQSACARSVAVSVMASVAAMRSALEKWSVEELTSYTENAGFPFVNFACDAVSSLLQVCALILASSRRAEMMKLKSNQTRTYDGDGYKKRAACLCFRSETEEEVRPGICVHWAGHESHVRQRDDQYP